MSVRHSLLALLADEPAHGYGLKSEFEKSTAGAWPLNVGQVYTTLVAPGARRPGRDRRGRRRGARVTWRITARRARRTGVRGTPRQCDDASGARRTGDQGAGRAGGRVDRRDPRSCRPSARRPVERAAGVDEEQDGARTPRRISRGCCVLDALILKAEAEVKWLDHVRGAAAPPARPGARDERARRSLARGAPLRARDESVHGTRRRTAVRALGPVSFAVAAGELVAVMGPSGSGKSTLL